MLPLNNLSVGTRRFGASQATLSFIGYYLIISISDLLSTNFGKNLLSSHPELNSINFQISMKLVGTIVGMFLSGTIIWLLIKQYFKKPLFEIGLIKSSITWNLVAIVFGIIASRFIVNFSREELSSTADREANPFNT